MLLVLYGIVIWGVVPLIMVVLFFYACSLIESDNNVAKGAGVAALLIGILIFVVFLIGRASAVVFQVPTFDLNNLPGLDFSSWLFLIIGLVVGFFLLWVVEKNLKTRWIALIILVLSAVSLISLFEYLFDPATRYTIFFLMLGIAIGMLARRAFLSSFRS